MIAGAGGIASHCEPALWTMLIDEVAEHLIPRRCMNARDVHSNERRATVTTTAMANVIHSSALFSDRRWYFLHVLFSYHARQVPFAFPVRPQGNGDASEVGCGQLNPRYRARAAPATAANRLSRRNFQGELSDVPGEPGVSEGIRERWADLLGLIWKAKRPLTSCLERGPLVKRKRSALRSRSRGPA